MNSLFLLLGNKPSMVDYMIWPWFERLDAINPFSHGAFVIPFESKFPRLVRFGLIIKLYLYI